MFSSNFESSIVTPSGAGGNWLNDGLIRDAAQASTHEDGKRNILYSSSHTAMSKTKPRKSERSRKILFL